MGITSADCGKAARLLGKKVIATEFLAYIDLGGIVKNRQFLQMYNGTWHYDQLGDIILDATNRTLVGGILTVRTGSTDGSGQLDMLLFIQL